VLVCPDPAAPGGECAAISLDFHLAARSAGRGQSEKLKPTRWGELVKSGKYKGSIPAVDTIAERLAVVIRRHPLYASAVAIAAVPGRKHNFSDQLGYKVAKLTCKHLLAMTAVQEGGPDGRRQFNVLAPMATRGRVILVDDVYRTGRTLRAAAQALSVAGASDVLGLTATCTIRPTAPPCQDHSTTRTSPSPRGGPGG